MWKSISIYWQTDFWYITKCLDISIIFGCVEFVFILISTKINYAYTFNIAKRFVLFQPSAFFFAANFLRFAHVQLMAEKPNMMNISARKNGDAGHKGALNDLKAKCET